MKSYDFNTFHRRRDEFIEKYNLLHKYCPKCGSTFYKTTLVGYPIDSSNPDEYKDLNKCTCANCKDVHTYHDRVSANNQKI
jgi:predicted nucleic-acid-binding Zn-ribbon protein